MPHLSSFLGLIIEFIKDINFKICLTAIQITKKLLVLNVQALNKHKNNLASILIQKLSDSKVVIRQAVLKCCGFIIANSQVGLMTIADQSLKNLQHTNWHVREGVLHLIANCLLAQAQQDELNGPMTEKDQELHHMVFDQMFVGDLC